MKFNHNSSRVYLSNGDTLWTSVYQSPLGWLLEVWHRDRVIAREHPLKKPDWRDKRAMLTRCARGLGHAL